MSMIHPLRTLARRGFATSANLRNAATTPSAPLKKPVGAFRGGIFGFLLGSTVTGAASYLYVYEEYKLANDLLTEDLDSVRQSVGRLELHLRGVEERLANQVAAANKVKK